MLTQFNAVKFNLNWLIQLNSIMFIGGCYMRLLYERSCAGGCRRHTNRSNTQPQPSGSMAYPGTPKCAHRTVMQGSMPQSCSHPPHFRSWKLSDGRKRRREEDESLLRFCKLSINKKVHSWLLRVNCIILNLFT